MATQLDSGPPDSARPTGTVAFLFTDIEGSAQRWEAYREAMDDAVKRHDAVLRDAIEQHNGYVFKAIGDAFCVAFARVSDAVAAAFDVQRALSAEDFSTVGGLSIRIGLHAGEASERNGDYFGPAVNRVARLMAIGHGGQILVSSVTRDLAHNDLPAGASLLDLGSHWLRDLTEPEHVWQLSIAGLPAEFPPLRSPYTSSNNLPIARTSFVGRENDVAEVKELLDRHRLLTLVGTGGVGKTRLAIQVGADLLDRYPDGVWFVDLAPIRGPELVASAVAQTLGIAQQQGQRIDEATPRWLKRKELLLILDNCEHVVASVAMLADAILATATDVRILATSRQSLDISGEAVHRLPSLAVPAEGSGLTSHEALNYGAIMLFVDRASAADTGFVLTDDNSPIVAEICRRLDGIALAIELAAARVRILSISDLAQRLNERFKILTGGSRSALPRQKTLTALIDWSYDLLTPQEQRLFSRLGVFAGGAGLNAAAAVCGEGLDVLDILDLLSSLTDKSLVVADTRGAQARYRLLESTAAYALERLGIAGEHERMARRHAEYFRNQAEDFGERYGSGSNARWLADVEVDLDNYRAALQWTLGDRNDIASGAAIVGALEQLWFRGGLSVEGIEWIRCALNVVDQSSQPSLVARLWRTLAWLCDGKQRCEAAHRALAIYESIEDEAGKAWALTFVGFGLHQTGRANEAEPAYEQALAIMRRLRNRWGIAVILNRQATLRRDRGELDAARALYMEALDAMKVIGNEASIAIGLTNLAELEFADGNVQRALTLVMNALAIEERGKNATQLANIYTCICAYRIELGNLELAAADAREGLRWARRAQNPLAIAIALQHIALLASMREMRDSSARLLGYVEARYRELEYKLEVTEEWGHKKLMASLDARDRAENDALLSEGSAWSEDRAFEEAIAVLGERP